MDSPVAFFAAAAAPLADGRVLITGGRDGADDKPVNAAFILDTRSLTIQPTKAMSTQRAYHTATTLADGRVLIVGDGSAELFDPHLQSFSPIVAPTLSHRAQAAALLGDGTVLIAGGVESTDSITAAAERFDPKTQVFRPAGAMSEPKVNATALSLPTGDVVVVGGHTIETFSIKAGAFLSPIPIQGAVDPAAVALPDGRVLLVGGLDSTAASQPRKGDTGIPASQDITLFDPATSTFRRVGQMSTARYEAGAVLIDNNRVLVTGGMRDSHEDAGLIDSAETIDIATWATAMVGPMHEARFYHVSVLSGGRIAVIGSPTSNPHTSVDVFIP